jgi:hypothetical protein
VEESQLDLLSSSLSNDDDTTREDRLLLGKEGKTSDTTCIEVILKQRVLLVTTIDQIIYFFSCVLGLVRIRSKAREGCDVLT